MNSITASFSFDDHMHKKPILDVRTLLLVGVVMSTVMLFTASVLMEVVFFCMSCIVLLMFKDLRLLGRYCLIYGVLHGLVILNRIPITQPTIHGLLTAFSLFSFMIAKMIPIVMLTHLIMRKIPSAVFICALRKLKLHGGLILSITIAFRFLPTARKEFFLIKDSMKMRGIEISWKNLVTKPLTILEFSLIPLLFRSLTISEEMTAAAMVKGVEFDGKKTSVIDVSFTYRDALFLGIFTGTVIGAFFLISLIGGKAL